MIKSLTVTNSIGESLNLELTNPWKNGIAIKSINGLGSPQYTVNTTPFASGDGSTLGSIIASSRNIVFEFYPLFHPMVEDSRQLLYRYFQVKKPIILTFELDNRTAYIEGYVEENTPDIFSKRETIQISVICPSPYFREAAPLSSFFFGEIPMFEFPFSNESLTESLLILSELSVDNRAQIDYTAEIDSGILITIDCFSETGDINIYDVNTLGKIYISTNKVAVVTGRQLSEKDQIIISTYSSDRYIHLLREGKLYNILACVNKDADWFQIHQGKNSYTYTTQIEHASIVMTFKYTNMYASI